MAVVGGRRRRSLVGVVVYIHYYCSTYTHMLCPGCLGRHMRVAVRWVLLVMPGSRSAVTLKRSRGVTLGSLVVYLVSP